LLKKAAKRRNRFNNQRCTSNTKKFRYELTERQRQRANDKLRISRDEFEEGQAGPAEAKLREALASFVEMKAVYDANH